MVQDADGRKSPARTYQDLLKNPHDESLLEHHASSRITILKPGAPPEFLDPPDLFSHVSVSPNGQFLLTVRFKRPFSLALPLDFFPKSIEVRDLRGNIVTQIAEVPLLDNIPIEGVRTGPRSIQWWPGHQARLLWTEALDGGDPNRKTDFREQLFIQDAPFDKPPVPLLRLKDRYTGSVFFKDPSMWITTQYDRDRRWTTSTQHRIHPFEQSTPHIESQIFFDRSIRDRYADPGRIMLEPDSSGFSIAKQIQNSVILAGVGASPEGNRPFLDLKSLDTLESNRIWRCSDSYSENVVALWTQDSEICLLTRRESPQDPPKYFVRSTP